MKTLIGFIFIFMTGLSVFAQGSNGPQQESITTVYADIASETKTRLEFMISEGGPRLAARTLSKLLEETPNSREINLVLASSENESEIRKRLSRDINAAAQRGVIINLIPISSSLVESLNTEVNGPTGLQAQLDEVLNEEKIEERTAQNSLRLHLKGAGQKLTSSLSPKKWGGVIVASLLGAGVAASPASTWVFATDTPVTYEVTSGFIAAAIFHMLTARPEFAVNTSDSVYDFLRTGKYMFQRFFSRDSTINPPSRLGQGSVALLGGYLFATVLQTGVLGQTIGLENIPYDMVLRNSLFIAAAGTPWTLTANKLKQDGRLSNSIIYTSRALGLLGLGYLALNTPGITESYLRAYHNLSWSEWRMLAMGGTGLAANYYGTRIINKIEPTIWFQWLNRNFETLARLPENTLRRFTGKGAKNKFWNIHSLRQELRTRQCRSFLSAGS